MDTDKENEFDYSVFENPTLEQVKDWLKERNYVALYQCTLYPLSEENQLTIAHGCSEASLLEGLAHTRGLSDTVRKILYDLGNEQIRRALKMQDLG